MPALNQRRAVGDAQGRRRGFVAQQEAQPYGLRLLPQPGGPGADIGPHRVNVVNLLPKQCVGGQEISHFGPVEVKSQQRWLSGNIGVINPGPVKPA